MYIISLVFSYFCCKKNIYIYIINFQNFNLRIIFHNSILHIYLSIIIIFVIILFTYLYIYLFLNYILK